VRTKVKTPGAGEIVLEEAVQAPTWRSCANSIIPTPGFMPGPQHYIKRPFFKKKGKKVKKKL
jgi:hypothetical protein